MKQHHEWIYVGKGLAIVLVVILHITDWMQTNTGYESDLFRISDNMRSLRMPLFFMISGLLTSFSLSSGGVGSVFRKCANLYFLMVVWSVIVVARIVAVDGEEGRTFADLLLSMFVAPLYWYLWALIIFSMIASAAWRIGHLCSAPVIVLGIISHFYSADIGQFFESVVWSGFRSYAVEMTAKNLIWFLFGFYLSKLIVGFQASFSPYVGAIALFSCLAIVCVTWGVKESEFAFFISSLSWMVAAIVALPYLSKLKLSNLFSYLGKRTLSIYVMHLHVLIFPKILIIYGVSIYGGDVAAIALCIFVILTCISIESVMRRIGFGIIFDGPIKKQAQHRKVAAIVPGLQLSKK